MKYSSMLLSIVAVTVGFSADRPFEDKGLKQELEAIRKTNLEIQRSIQSIQDILLGKAPALDNVFVSLKGSPVRGDTHAKVVLIEFSDYQCSYCGAFARQAFRRLDEEYIKTGKLQVVFRNFPLEEGHPLARKAAEAALCAGNQGKYWEAHDLFFNNQNLLSKSDLLKHGDVLALNRLEFAECLDSGSKAAVVEQDLSDGVVAVIGDREIQ